MLSSVLLLHCCRNFALQRMGFLLRFGLVLDVIGWVLKNNCAGFVTQTLQPWLSHFMWGKLSHWEPAYYKTSQFKLNSKTIHQAEKKKTKDSVQQYCQLKRSSNFFI